MQRGKEATIYDIANQLNISIATVSRALKDDPVVSKKTKKKIFETAERLGYRTNHYASSLRKQQTNTIGFMVHELQSNFINSVLAGVEKVATEAGYDLVIAHSQESYEKEVANAKNLFHKRVDGLITSLSFDTKNLDHFRPFTDKGVPIVFFDRVESDSDHPVVVIDNYRCGYQATRHLIDQGCKKIVHVTSNLARNVYTDRFQGYRDALAEHGLAFDDSLVIIGDLSEQAGIDSARRMLDLHPRPDGAFITNDFVAAVCMRTLKQYHIAVPRDIAVVGFNNDAIGQLIEPALTTINYPGREMGEVAAQNLVNHLKGLGSLRQIDRIIINADLIIRGSSLKRGTGLSSS
ncbi:MAG TPA: LacI family DNA-binding transcriptional regulator [Puia sp.]